jgi:hypothetical protein
MKKYRVTLGSYKRSSCDFEPVNAEVYEHLQSRASKRLLLITTLAIHIRADEKKN